MKVLTSTTGAVAAVIVAAALGLPVGSWAALGAMACFGIGCLGFMLGGEELGKALMKPAALLLVVAIVAPAIGGGLRAALSEPSVLAAIAGLACLGLAAGMLYLLAKSAEVVHKKAPRPRFGVGEPVEPVNPIRLEDVFGRPGSGPARRREEASTRSEPAPDDDLGIFTRGRRR